MSTVRLDISDNDDEAIDALQGVPATAVSDSLAQAVDDDGNDISGKWRRTRVYETTWTPAFLDVVPNYRIDGQNITRIVRRNGKVRITTAFDGEVV